MTTMTSSTFAFARYPDLAGVSVLVSGGASGIGEWIVRGYAEQGAKVGFVDLDRQAGDRLAAELSGSSAVRFEVCDITDTTAYRAAIGSIAAAHGPVRVLINNAANDDRHDWRDVTPEAFDRAAAVNLRHAFFAIQAVAPAMIDAGGGAIVNLGSIGWMTATAGYPVYAASKAAAHGLTRAFARELGQHAIRVNTLVPGWTMTRKQLDLRVRPQDQPVIDASQCLAGRVMPCDVAAMALFLGSSQSRMCSAQNFIVDGGWA